MMYWGILAFAVLSASSLVKSTVGDFQCPVCNARGPNARAECDKKITYKTCTQENPICVSTLYTFGRFLRDCSDESNYQTNLENCKRYKTCRKAKCKEPKCKAEIPLVCPYCESSKSLKHCDMNIETQTCQQWETRFTEFEREDTVERASQFEYSRTVEITTELMSELEQYLFF